jgi:SAM-dependent methyltransferase
MLDVARAAQLPADSNVDWQQGDAMALPFANDSFDAVVCQHGMQFFADRAQATREMHRVLKPGGHAAIIVLQSLQLHPVFDAIMQSVARHLPCPLRAAAMPFDMSEAEPLRHLFTSAGFASTAIHAETIVATFPDAQRFVPLAVNSSAAAVPAFAALDASQRALLTEAVGADVKGVVDLSSSNGSVSFPMHAHVVGAIR